MKRLEQLRVEDALRKVCHQHTLHVHMVFSTKDRLPLIDKTWRDRLHSYLGGIVRGLEGVPLAIGGIADHVHLLVGLKSSHRIDYFLRDLKADSSAWVHQEIGKRIFGWQKGYGAFSVSPSNICGRRIFNAQIPRRTIPDLSFRVFNAGFYI